MSGRPLVVLVACEFSGIVRDAFNARGHYAVSCDLIDSERPGPHFKGDVFDLLAARDFDMMIAHPPCQFLAASGARWWRGREENQRRAVNFVRALAAQPIQKIAIENPVGALTRQWRAPNQYIQPWQFGHGETKKTGLWLKGLPPLKPTQVVDGRVGRVWREAPGPERWKARSRTYSGIADAMAQQWGAL